MPKKKKFAGHKLSRRESQIMDAVHKLGKASVRDVMDNIPDPPTSCAVRSAMNILVKKNLLKSKHDGPQKVYTSTISPSKVRNSMMEHVLDTYFQGSLETAMASLINSGIKGISEKDMETILKLIKKNQAEGK